MERGGQSITLGDDRLCLSGKQLSDSHHYTFMGADLERLIFFNYLENIKSLQASLPLYLSAHFLFSLKLTDNNKGYLEASYCVLVSDVNILHILYN